MTQVTPRLIAAIKASKIPDKEIARIINEAGMPRVSAIAPAQSPHDALADAHGITLPETPDEPESPAAESAVEAERPRRGRRRGYNTRDMKAE